MSRPEPRPDITDGDRVMMDTGRRKLHGVITGRYHAGFFIQWDGEDRPMGYVYPRGNLDFKITREE